MCADGASGITKADLPKHGEVEQAFHQNHGGEQADRFQGKQAALGPGQQPVWEGGADTATVKVDNLILLTAREDHAPAEGIAALAVDQAGPQERIERIAERGQMPP